MSCPRCQMDAADEPCGYPYHAPPPAIAVCRACGQVFIRVPGDQAARCEVCSQ